MGSISNAATGDPSQEFYEIIDSISDTSALSIDTNFVSCSLQSLLQSSINARDKQKMLRGIGKEVDKEELPSNGLVLVCVNSRCTMLQSRSREGKPTLIHHEQDATHDHSVYTDCNGNKS